MFCLLRAFDIPSRNDSTNRRLQNLVRALALGRGTTVVPRHIVGRSGCHDSENAFFNNRFVCNANPTAFASLDRGPLGLGGIYDSLVANLTVAIRLLDFVGSSR